ncbi:putative non-specific lipid-transfer protein 14 [Olea europaea var. sylvestris]|uniref:Non-specific lipid-transfer 14 n=1 Tax=Olea europaea subsp. europaea TaxID=158383 RepID=A0A8S0UIH3_OLEEU|nr:putative non-specific lipid-transfer protein 14 [Olea europaea var. sylvestris]CAA3015280.1 non-specific lipid-transfer 14 [Olea europaea subsp. europaea]
MGSNTNNILLAILVITLVSWSAFVDSTTAPGMAVADCTTITALISACSSFVTYGLPDPVPGSPCCIAMTSLNSMADTSDNRRGVCRCLMDLITTYNPNATAIATLPGFCGVSLGFTIDPNTDCEYIDS